MKKLLLSLIVLGTLTSCEKYELEDFEKKPTPTPVQQPNPNPNPNNGWVNPPIFDLGGNPIGGGPG
jgi:hypothetical protein